MKNQNGQALLETVFALPTILVLVGIVLIGACRFTTHYLMDHWVYQSSLCMAKEVSSERCLRQMDRKVQMMPFVRYSLNRVVVRKNRVLIELTYSSPVQLPLKIIEHLRLPITSEQMRRSQ